MPTKKEFSQPKNRINQAGSYPHSDETPAHRTQHSAVVDLRNKDRTNKTRRHPANRDLVWNYEVLEINESGNDQASQKQIVNQHQPEGLMAEREPYCQESKASQEFHQKVTYGDRRPAIPAFAAQIKPGDQRQIQVPR